MGRKYRFIFLRQSRWRGTVAFFAFGKEGFAASINSGQHAPGVLHLKSSRPVFHSKTKETYKSRSLLFLERKTTKQENQNLPCRGQGSRDGLTERNLYFSSLREENANKPRHPLAQLQFIKEITVLSLIAFICDSITIISSVMGCVKVICFAHRRW